MTLTLLGVKIQKASNEVGTADQAMAEKIPSRELYRDGEEEVDWLKYDHDERARFRNEFHETRSRERWIGYCRETGTDPDFMRPHDD